MTVDHRTAQGAHIRAMTAGDLPALGDVIAATALFPAALLDGMAAPWLHGEAEAGFWLTAAEDAPVGLAYCAPERMTEGTWNLLLIAVHPGFQRRGHGAALVRHAEARLAGLGAHLLLVETSGLDGFAATRTFYRRLGYGEEARIRDFYRAGEDKIVFRKALAGPA